MDGVRFLIITGLSGAGKSYAMRVFEDLNFFVVDNLPPALLPKFADLCLHSDGKVQRVAVVIDIRGGEFFDDLFQALGQLQELGVDHQILFLDASDEVLVRRFKETRRKHPLAQGRTVLQGIRAERRRLEAVKERADKIIDTSALTVHDLREEIIATYVRGERAGALEVSIISFGYKYGLPMDADLVFDVRFLPNPHYLPALRPLPGASRPVRAYVLGQPETRTFLQHLFEMVDYLLPRFVQEGKSHLSIALGCTGGKHRSVVLADELGAHLRRRGYKVRVHHRDVRKE
ncbi:MAG: RNase adapter RapZ [Armatimonadota bacterium]|nr:RNase adapter RapZ [Armatimonadota bacterium]MDR7426911.1 RNase adapter RapZ [Armatimonadota bacterium]MDR7463479.1 RNase adapter RapZ [Armatimonadota bacterium]MDR7474176.1 RNase adapter RapZ [Armatimonadota bacterium]MDR7539280.1 RNase adapter RapZ [Armatimonadota bacterium]